MSFCRAQNLFTTSQDVSSFHVFLRIDNSTQPISTRPELHQACGVARRVKGVTTSRLFFLCEFGRHWGKAWKDRFPDPNVSTPPQNSENPISKGWEWEWKKKIIRPSRVRLLDYFNPCQNDFKMTRWLKTMGLDFSLFFPLLAIQNVTWAHHQGRWRCSSRRCSPSYPAKQPQQSKPGQAETSWTLVNTNLELKRNSSFCRFLCLSLVLDPNLGLL